jgi:hypothetical protein
LRVFDYIYGVLHSPDYRATYAQFLKIDFPRIPYPASPEIFAHVAEKGGQLRRLHLMEDAAIGATPYPFKGDGDNAVVKPAFAVSSSPSTCDGEGDHEVVEGPLRQLLAQLPPPHRKSMGRSKSAKKPLSYTQPNRVYGINSTVRRPQHHRNLSRCGPSSSHFVTLNLFHLP